MKTSKKGDYPKTGTKGNGARGVQNAPKVTVTPKMKTGGIMKKMGMTTKKKK